MLLLLHIIVTYFKENVITKLQKLYSPPKNPRAGNKLPVLFVKKPLCMGDLSPGRKIFIERPGIDIFNHSVHWVINLSLKNTTSFFLIPLTVSDFSVNLRNIKIFHP